jgi:hypothetical protein
MGQKHITARAYNVCFHPESGPFQRNRPCLLWAKRRHLTGAYLADRNRWLDGADVGKLDGSHRRRRLELLRNKPRHA